MADHDRFVRAVQIVARGLGRISRECAHAGKVTPQQAETLQLINERGAVSTSMLAVMLGIDPSTASRNLKHLEEKKGYITRKKDSEDARQTDVRLTPRGKRTADAVNGDSAQAFLLLMEKLPRSERVKVVEALDVLARVLDAQ
jgi:DNA-binding MarR family transcriptional regulator